MDLSNESEIIVTGQGDAQAAEVKNLESENEAELETDEESVENESEESDESDNSEEKETEETEVKKEGKKKNSFQKRIEKIKRREVEALKEVEFWKKEALKAKPESNNNESKPPQKAVDSRPRSESFDTHEEYVEALTDWKLDQRELAKQQEVAQLKQKETVNKWQERINSFTESTPDFEEVMEGAGDVIFPLEVSRAITESDLGPAVLYELAKDQENATRISKLSTIAAILEIGKIQARLESKTQKQTTTISKAPKPISPVKGNGKPHKDINDPSLSQADYEALRQKQLDKRAG